MAGVRALFEAGSLAGRSDGELLDLFLATDGPGAELAFAALVERHGPTVWRVCRAVLREPSDADDAFQATFLVLVRRAGAIRWRSSLGPWLHGVALRVARSARRSAARRRDRERVDAGPEPEGSAARVDRLDEASVLREEVDRLPAKYRGPLELCYFQGLTHDEAAGRLGWPVGTVRSRLAGARARLRPRLLRRGVAPSAAILAVSGRAEAAAVVPAPLASATIRAAVGAGAAGTVPAAVAALAGTTLRGMTIVKTSMIAAGLLAASLGSIVVAGRVAGTTPGVPGREDRAPGVSIQTVRPTTVTVQQRYAAQIRPRRRIEVPAPVDGTLEPIPLRDGQAVKAGDRLFEVTSPGLRLKLSGALAERRFAQIRLENAMKLAKRNVVSDDDVKLARAKLVDAQAEADRAQAEVDRATFKAPFDGVVGLLEAWTAGNVNQGDPLVTLTDAGELWVFFNVPRKDALEPAAGRREGEAGPAFELTLADQRKFPRPGKFGAIEPRAKDEEGPIPHRADFPNPDGTLPPGQAGVVSIRRVVKDAIVIPKRATFEERGKTHVYLVGMDNVARKREVALGAEVDDGFVVESGINAGDRVVTDGLDKVHDGNKLEG